MLHHERTPVGVLFSWWSIAVGRNASFARGKAEALPRLPQGNGRNRKRHFVVGIVVERNSSFARGK